MTAKYITMSLKWSSCHCDYHSATLTLLSKTLKTPSFLTLTSTPPSLDQHFVSCQDMILRPRRNLEFFLVCTNQFELSMVYPRRGRLNLALNSLPSTSEENSDPRSVIFSQGPQATADQAGVLVVGIKHNPGLVECAILFKFKF